MGATSHITSLALALLASVAAAEETAVAGADGTDGAGADGTDGAGAPGGSGLAIRCAKAVTVADAAPVIDGALVLVKDGRIEAVGSVGELDVPDGYELLDVGESWVLPGFIDLHSHIAGTRDINGAVYQTNPGLRVWTSVRPGGRELRMGVAGGVTSILFIPGSATNIGGQGILLKTGLDTFEEMRIRAPGSLKLAQADNPKAWGWGMGRLTMNWQIRDTFRRGRAYAKRWEAFEQGGGDRPDVDPQYEVFRDLYQKKTQISAHTQAYQVVYQTIRIAHMEMGYDVFIDHGTFDGFLAAELAEREGVPAILGPRSISSQNKGRSIDHDGRILGVAAEYQRRGHSTIGFNTDAFVIPQEELQLQSAMAVRYGFDDSDVNTIRGLTIVPARTAKIDHRVGSIEPGKDADLIVVTGHPADPRNSCERVFIEGREVYDAEEERIW